MYYLAIQVLSFLGCATPTLLVTPFADSGVVILGHTWCWCDCVLCLLNAFAVRGAVTADCIGQSLLLTNWNHSGTRSIDDAGDGGGVHVVHELWLRYPGFYTLLYKLFLCQPFIS